MSYDPILDDAGPTLNGRPARLVRSTAATTVVLDDGRVIAPGAVDLVDAGDTVLVDAVADGRLELDPQLSHQPADLLDALRYAWPGLIRAGRVQLGPDVFAGNGVDLK